MTYTLQETSAIFLQLRAPNANTTDAALRNELVMAYIALWYYSANTNVWASFSLPPVHEFDENTSYHALIKTVIDKSFNDFSTMTGLVRNLTPDQIEVSTFRHLYDEVQNVLIPLVGDTAHHFSRQSKTHEN